MNSQQTCSLSELGGFFFTWLELSCTFELLPGREKNKLYRWDREVNTFPFLPKETNGFFSCWAGIETLLT